LQNIELAGVSQEVVGAQPNGFTNRGSDHLRYEEYIGAKKHLVLGLLSPALDPEIGAPFEFVGVLALANVSENGV
jgi:hypothetical protein